MIGGQIMSIKKDLISMESDGKLSFGDYTLETKSKQSDFEHNGDLYKVKTFKEITKLERNDLFVYESVPGTAVKEFEVNASGMEFVVEGEGTSQITVELEGDTEYEVFINGESHGKMNTNLGGKLNLSIDFDNGANKVKITK